ncbi:hypothetical protein AVEN_208853-1 [Araneus ventricosus]|uniref:Uncharacterized protein n=1 Tax=Araneus ventricosus TaxID=182803 RepID=A0A4Y2KL47_ARAVE|nr:hypothetical protein AVEN_208853-1 [Araneus ventricosus]
MDCIIVLSFSLRFQVPYNIIYKSALNHQHMTKIEVSLWNILGFKFEVDKLMVAIGFYIQDPPTPIFHLLQNGSTNKSWVRKPHIGLWIEKFGDGTYMKSARSYGPEHIRRSKIIRVVSTAS